MSVPAKKYFNPRRMIGSVVIGLLSGYAVLAAFAYLRQESMIYCPTREIEATPADRGLAYEAITLTTPDHVKIAGWFIPSGRARGAVLFCHGNAGNISHRLDSISIFHGLDLDVLIFDYRGYGMSQGAPTEKGTYLDAEAAWEYLSRERGFDPGKIVIFGRSLGSAVAVELASRHEAGALIMESGFTSVPALGQKIFPHLPVRLMSRYRYASIDKVAQLSVPKLFIHSPDDEIIPYEHGRALFEKAGVPKEFLVISGSHNEGFLTSGSRYHEGIRTFLLKYLDGYSG